MQRHLLVLSALALATLARAWDHPGHMIVNQIGLASLPADFPAFAREAENAERIAFLSGEPDRWSHSNNLPLRHDNWPEHYFDTEQMELAGLLPAALPSLRYAFVVQFAEARAAHQGNFPVIDPAKNADRTRELCGLLPWVVAEHFGMLKEAFSSLKVYEELGTPAEIANAKANIVYLMGVMGHYVGDSAQPLHTTDRHNGWVGDNPNGYTTWNKFHSWIDSGLINKTGINFAGIAPHIAPAQPLSLAVRPDGRDPIFVASLDFIYTQHEQVEVLYRLEKEGKLGNPAPAVGTATPAPGGPVAPEAKALIEGQLLKAGERLGSLWLTAWRAAAPDAYLRGVLLRRQAATIPAAK